MRYLSFASLKLLHVLLLALLATWTLAQRCDRTPKGVVSPASRADGRYVIGVSGNPETYTAGDKYTIYLRSVNDYSQPQKFTDFMIIVEHDTTVKVASNFRGQNVGNLSLFSNTLVQFSHTCPSTVIQTSSVPKTEVSVYWVAPPKGSGCVAIKATVVESRQNWYSEDGPLTKVLCEEIQDNDDNQPLVLSRCCACHEAKYEVTFEGLWSRNTHPKDFPSNSWLTRFSDIIGASHSVPYTFWSYGKLASDGLRQLAENGNTRKLESELKSNSDYIRTIIKARGISYPNITGKTFAVFRVDSRHHLMSLVSMIHPSPDWIVGVSGLELCLQNCSWIESKTLNLYPWDVGTDDGPSYLSENQPSIPRQPIRRLTSNSPNDPRSPFYDENGVEMKPLARLVLSRQRLYEKPCEPDIESTENEECEVTAWREWSPCTTSCGKGMMHRQRSYKNSHTNARNQHEKCNKQLTQRRVCMGHQNICRDMQDKMNDNCQTTDWGHWSTCSVTCGKGTQTRSRRYMNRSAAKQCGIESPQMLEQNMECEIANCHNVDPEIRSECRDRKWSEWSPCSSSCGKGVKLRHKLPASHSENSYNQRYLREATYDDEDDEDEENDEYPEQNEDNSCVDVVEKVECVNDDSPVCDEHIINPAIACSLPKDVGLCRSNVDRWYFDNIRGKCELFSYSGCEGNVNNYRTLEQCETICGDYQRDLLVNRTVQKHQLGATVSGVLSYNMQNDEAAQENCGHNMTIENQVKPVTCKVSSWSPWSECSATCGRAFKYKTREIEYLTHGGGHRCPKKSQKKHRCKTLPCKTNRNVNMNTGWVPIFSSGGDPVDCEVSDWSKWTSCTQSCGRNSIKQRTRKVTQKPMHGGRDCPNLVESKACHSTVCPDYY